MPRWRLGVALLISEPLRSEINGLRRALSDGALDRIPPHLTLVPPVNVRVDELAGVLRLLRSAAATVEEFTVRLGPVSTFAPLTPVVKLDVHDVAGDILRLREAIFQPPLQRTLTWPFVPHVTLADDASESKIAAAVEALDGYEVEATFDSITLLREEGNRRWHPVADAYFGEVPSSGVGSVPLFFYRSTIIEPPVADHMDDDIGQLDLVVTARTEDDEAAGVAGGRIDGTRFVLTNFAVRGSFRGIGVGPRLLQATLKWASEVGATECIEEISCPQIRAFLGHYGFDSGVLKL